MAEVEGKTGPGAARLINVKSNADIAREEEAALALEAPIPVDFGELLGMLNGYWSDAKQAKMPIEDRIMKCKREIEGEYDPNKAAAIKQMKGSEVYMRLGAQKKRDGVSWVMDILKPTGDRLWTLESTPEPDLPPDVEAEVTLQITEGIVSKIQDHAINTGALIDPAGLAVLAEEEVEASKELIKKALLKESNEIIERMAVKIEDQMLEGAWFSTFKDAVDDIFSYPSCIVKAPIIRNQPQKNWTLDENDNWIPDVKNVKTPNFDRVSPWDFYPEGDSGHVNEGYVFERHRLTRKALNAMLGVPGYRDEAIREVIREYGTGGLHEWLWTDTERSRMEGKEWNILRSRRIDCLEWSGSMQGKVLLEGNYGITPEQIPDPDLDYEVNIWYVKNYVIRAVLNPDMMGDKMYYVTSFEKSPGQIWGKSVVEVVEDVCTMYNSAARALHNNVAIASGPQVEVDTERYSGSENIDDMRPWRVWPSTNSMMHTSPAVRFYQPPMHAQKIIAVMEKLEKMADNQSGIPSYSHGDPQVGGAGNTASGLSMLMTAAARGIKNVIQNIDLDVISPIIGKLYDHNMQFDPDKSIKGDARVKAGGSQSLIAKEQLALRKQELLTTLNNPTDLAILGMGGREEQVKDAFNSAEMDTDKYIQGKDEAQPQPAPAATGTPEAPAEELPSGEKAGGEAVRTITQKGATE